MTTAIAVADAGRQEGALAGAAVRTVRAGAAVRTVRAAGGPRTAWI
jgi:hypothetical protein